MTVILILVLLVAGAAIWWQRRLTLDERAHFNTLLAHRDAEIDRVLADNKDLRDRVFTKHHMPPAGVNVQAAYEQRVEEAEERPPRSPNARGSLSPVQRAQQQAIDKMAETLPPDAGS